MFLLLVCAPGSTKIQTMQQKDGSYSFFIHGKVADIELAKAAIKVAFTAVVWWNSNAACTV